MSKKRFLIFGVILMLFVSFVPRASFAFDEEHFDTYSQNNILFYDPTCSGGGNVSVCNTSLPEETVKLLEDAGVKEKAESNMDRYKYAEEKTGIPWQAVAALHYREASMASDASISNGQKLATGGRCYKNFDKLEICGDANEDASDAAKHFIRMAKMVYDIELTDSSTIDDWGQAFLAYNRGFIYKRAGVDWKDSPYSMNGFDDDHALYMQRPPIENTAPMHLTGKDANAGALAVFAYLCGGDEASNVGSNSSEDGSDVTIIGDSITNAAKNAILEKLPLADIYAQDCKTVGYDFSKNCGGSTGENKSGLTIVKELNANNTLRGKVVFLLGTNLAEFNKLQDAIDEIGSDRDIYLMSLYTVKDSYDSQNKTIKKIVEDQSNVNLIDWASKVKDNASLYLSDGTHPNADGQKIFAELIYNAVSTSDDICPTDTGTNGFSSKEEAEAVIIAAYESMSSSDLGSSYGLVLPDTGDYHDNCVAFSTWFINHYTDISYKYPPNGNLLVGDFYDKNKSKYPDLKIEDTPSVYAIASWSKSGQFTTGGNHTGVVIGINEAEDTIMIAEANWNNPDGGVIRDTARGGGKLKLSEASGPGNQYININKYLKSNTGLK